MKHPVALDGKAHCESSDPGVAEASDAATSIAADTPSEDTTRGALRTAMMAGLVMAIALTGLVGWLGVTVQRCQRAEAPRQEFLQAARQSAIDLTTIDYTHAEADVQRILDSATGGFHDDFAKRSQPFVDVLQKTQSKTEGTVTAAGLESESGDQARALVAVSVKTSNAGSPQPGPRAWRMRISVQRSGGQVKVSNVEFVP